MLLPFESLVVIDPELKKLGNSVVRKDNELISFFKKLLKSFITPHSEQSS